MKIYELANELNVGNKKLIEKANELGIEVKSHLNVLDDEQIEKIKNSFIGNDKNLVAQKQWKPDLQRMICLKNISRGKLVYVSKRQIGYKLEWAKKGDTNYIELGEFMSLKNTDRRFVTEPWIRIIEDDEIEILKYANIYQYYKDILDINNIAEILQLDFNSFQRKFDKLPYGFKNAVAEQAAEMIKNGTLDSIRIKKYIEEKMDIDLDLYVKSKEQISKVQDVNII